MALFENLHHAGEVLVHVISESLDSAVGSAEVQLGLPLDNPAGVTTPVVRITLMWVTPQPGHRNDPYEADPTGARVPPPVSLSVTYLITTYGHDSNTNDPFEAHSLLGNAIQAFHTYPSLSLPITGVEGLPDLAVGDGIFTATLVPIVPEILEDILSLFQGKPRPWALYEVGPVQLRKLEANRPPAAAVRPDGLILGGPRAGERGALVRVTPELQVVGGTVRLDVDLAGQALAGVSFGNLPFVPVGDLTALTPNETYLLTVPADAVPESVLDLRLRSDDPTRFSAPKRLVVLASNAPALNAGATSSVTADLVLSGRALIDGSGESEVLMWPDGPVPDPTRVKTPVATVTADSVTVTSTELGNAQVDPGVYRLAVRLANGVITPFVIQELTT